MTDKSSLDAGDIEIRRFRPEDRRRCIEIAFETWTELPPGITKEMNIAYWETLVGITEKLSAWKEVACDSGKVIGFLFGATERKIPMRTNIGVMKTLLSLKDKPAIRGLRDIRLIVPFLIRNMLTESKVWLHTPGSNGEVEFFVVDGSYRGRGVGRRLMTRFLAEAKERRIDQVTVYTTNPGCNWKFYEILGFKKVSEFDDDLVTFYEGRPTKGLIFAADI